MMIGSGINTVHVNGKVKHITELDSLTLSHEWAKLKNENSSLYSYNDQVNQGWRRFVLKLIGINLASKKRITLEDISNQKKSVNPE